MVVVILSNEICDLYTKEHFIQEFKNWSSGNANIGKIIQESQIKSIYEMFHWIPYDNFQNIEHIADGGYGSATFWDLRWEEKIEILASVTMDLDLDLSKLENNLILNTNNKITIYGSIPYIPSEVLRGNEFTKKGDIYSFGGIMYEVVTDHFDGPFERPTTNELLDNDMRQLKIADENQKNTSKSQKQELFELLSHSNNVLGYLSVCDKDDVGDDKNIGDGDVVFLEISEGDDGISNKSFLYLKHSKFES
ncbi:hypothetical protein Glove_155g10 [Diversispora epigaea]|uniref:Protein kinase domain-containing protein n=1 Tax=Diversispora epigaea TaxID=1348612 RepID=A0A397IS93_9GLOM|nr:hypothetical protein Glove_155g10 [Diversispora epigaea]